MAASDCVFVAFKKTVVALDRSTGSVRWQWAIPSGRAYPAILVDQGQVFVSAMGYTYCLDAHTGWLVWQNDLPGMGVGVASIATENGQSSSARAAAELTTQQAAQQHGGHS